MSVKPETSEEPITLTPEEARGGRQNKPILYVLMGSVIGAVIAVVIVFTVVSP